MVLTSDVIDGRSKKPFRSLTVGQGPWSQTVLEKLSPGDYNDVKIKVS